MTGRQPRSARLIAVLVLAAVGCGQRGASTSTLEDPTSPPITGSPNRPADRLSNGAIEIDEAGVRASAQDGRLRLTIPVRATRGGVGTLRAALVGVDTTESLGEVGVDYALQTGDKRELTAELPLPSDLERQADRVRYSVRLRDAGGSGLQVTRSLLYVLTPYALRLEGPSKLRSNKQASYRVRAEDPLRHAPLADQAVSLSVARDDGQAVQTLSAQTDETGCAVFDLGLDEPGKYSVAAQAAPGGGESSLASDVQVQAPGQKLLITTDKPIYQPGQTIHLRALSLHSPDDTPVADADVLFEVQDGKGNKVFKKTLRSDAYGIASTDFALASVVNMGTFKVHASCGQASGEKTVEVARYVLPKFAVELASDKPWYGPGATVAGSVDSRYFFGKRLAAAKVTIEALTLDVGSNVFARVMGTTDDQGHFGFSLQLPASLVGIPLQNGNALVTLRATVTDGAGQVVSKDLALTVSAQPLLISLVPEATELVPDIDNRVHVFATDPLGSPVAGAQVDVSGGAPDMQAKTDDFGHALLHFSPDAAAAPIVVGVTPEHGERVEQTFQLQAQQGAAHVLLRTDKAVYAVGDTVKVQVLASKDSGHAYVDWQNEGQSVDMRTLALEDGTASFDVPLDASLLGENRIEAYVVDASGNSVRAGRTIVVNREGGLQVSLEQDKPQYAPGETAQLTFTVKDQAGQPTPAALGVQIVDEAVFGLIDAQPGLLRTFFELEDAFAKPTYELHVPAVRFDQLLFEQIGAGSSDERRAAQTLAEAQLSALSGNPMLGLSLDSWPQTIAQAKAALAPSLKTERARLIEALKPVFGAALDALKAEGCTPQNYCNGKGSFVDALRAKVFAGAAPVDFWGNAYGRTLSDGYPGQLRLVSNGPDESRASDDDVSIDIDLPALGVPATQPTQPTLPQAAAPGAGANFTPALAGAAGAAASVPATTMTTPTGATNADANGAAPEPRVRKAFPETLYVNPALITDASGQVTVPVEMADSITSWRVSAMANARSGELGGGQAGVTVFQDFFVDVDFPAELTRGDHVEFPIVVYNYLKTPQTVRLELEQASWFSAGGSTSQSLELGAGEVRSVRVPVTVNEVGQQTLTVRAYGDKVSDAVARSVRVVADGLAVPSAQSGSLESGGVVLDTSVPGNAVDGSGVLYLDVFPAFLAQAVQGLDSMLAVPNGCFEQTTSTTWPNVLVTQYLEQTHQSSTEIQLKADSLISAGYQRLLTFEHSGGGFSWFGERDAMADVSVTAFGLMEFADMANVHEVDPAVTARTQSWLASQQQQDGSWQGGNTEFFSFQTSALRNTAFVVWALARSGYTGDAIRSGLDYVSAHLADAGDAYSLALAANAFAAAAPNDPALSDLFDRLDADKHEQDGAVSWDSGETQTNFYAGGRDSAVATTALVAHALLSANQGPAAAKGAIEYLTQAKDSNGNFGSTQASVWALKALLLAAQRGTESAVGQLDVSADGQSVASLNLDADQGDVVTRIDLTQFAQSGDHAVSLAFAGSGEVSYNLVSRYNLPWTAAPQPLGAPLALSVGYDRTNLAVDDTVKATVKVQNLTSDTQHMLLVTVGLPPGFDLLTDGLDAQVAAGQLSRYEHTGKQLILYLTQLAPNATSTLDYRLQANMPVRAADGGGRVQLYYQPSQQATASSTLLVATGT